MNHSSFLYQNQISYDKIRLYQNLSEERRGMVMREYQTVTKQIQEVTQIRCDCCGKIIQERQEDFLQIDKQWGYFSAKDGVRHQLDICEACYDRWRATFVLREAGME